MPYGLPNYGSFGGIWRAPMPSFGFGKSAPRSRGEMNTFDLEANWHRPAPLWTSSELGTGGPDPEPTEGPYGDYWRGTLALGNRMYDMGFADTPFLSSREHEPPAEQFDPSTPTLLTRDGKPASWSALDVINDARATNNDPGEGVRRLPISSWNFAFSPWQVQQRLLESALNMYPQPKYLNRPRHDVFTPTFR